MLLKDAAVRQSQRLNDLISLGRQGQNGSNSNQLGTDMANRPNTERRCETSDMKIGGYNFHISTILAFYHKLINFKLGPFFLSIFSLMLDLFLLQRSHLSSKSSGRAQLCFLQDRRNSDGNANRVFLRNFLGIFGTVS